MAVVESAAQSGGAAQCGVPVVCCSAVAEVLLFSTGEHRDVLFGAGGVHDGGHCGREHHQCSQCCCCSACCDSACLLLVGLPRAEGSVVRPGEQRGRWFFFECALWCWCGAGGGAGVVPSPRCVTVPLVTFLFFLVFVEITSQGSCCHPRLRRSGSTARPRGRVRSRPRSVSGTRNLIAR